VTSCQCCSARRNPSEECVCSASRRGHPYLPAVKSRARAARRWPGLQINFPVKTTHQIPLLRLWRSSATSSCGWAASKSRGDSDPGCPPCVSIHHSGCVPRGAARRGAGALPCACHEEAHPRLTARQRSAVRREATGTSGARCRWCSRTRRHSKRLRASNRPSNTFNTSPM